MYPKPTLAMPTDLSERPERDRRILEHLGQVKLIASRIHDKLPESVCLERAPTSLDVCAWRRTSGRVFRPGWQRQRLGSE